MIFISIHLANVFMKQDYFTPPTLLKALSLFFFSLAIAGTSPAVAQTTWYVSPSGDNVNAGTLASPFQTVSHAIGAASANDIVDLLPGTYPEASIVIDKTLTLRGPNVFINPNTGIRGPEAMIQGEVSFSGAPNNIFIKGLQFNGQSGPNGAIIGDFAGDGLSITLNLFSNISANTAIVKTDVTLRSNWLIAENKFTSFSAASGAGISLTDVSGLAVSENHFTSLAQTAISLSGSSASVNIFRNQISNANSSATANEGGIVVFGGSFTGALSITENTISNALNGLVIPVAQNITGKSITVFNNSFTGNTNKAILHNGTGVLNASGNWLGINTPVGVATAVSANVDYSPWLNVATDSDIPTAGFQGDFSYLNVDDGSPQSGIVGRIQEALGVVTSGGTVKLAPGEFTESVSISKTLTLQGSGKGVDPNLHSILKGSSLTEHGIFIASAVTGVTVRDLTVRDFTAFNKSGIYANGQNNGLNILSVFTLNNGASGASGGGIYANGPVDGITINGNVVSQNRSRGIVIWNGFKQNITITNNQVNDNNCCGIELQDGTASGVNISNNLLQNNFDNGIGVTGLMAGAGENVIANNTLINNGRFGIEVKLPNGTGLEAGDGAIVVRDNNISRSLFASDMRDYAGIAVFRRGWVSGSGNLDIPTGVVVKNNTVSGYQQTTASDGFGIVIEGTNMTVYGNTISNCDVGIQDQAGHTPYTANTNADGDQNNLADLYFGRGNSPEVCADIYGNIISSTPVPMRSIRGGGTGSSISYPAPLVENANTGLKFCSIQSAIDNVFTLNGHTVEVSSGTLNEQALVSKSLTILGVGATKPIINYTGAPAGRFALLDVIVPDVTIENIHFEVDLAKVKSAILASAPDVSNLTITGNEINPYRTGAPLGAYGDRNAISINYGGSTNYRVANSNPSGILVANNLITYDTNSTPLDPSDDAGFRAGVATDESGGSYSGNTLQTINHDLLVRFGNAGNVTITNNQLLGGGVELTEHNPGAGNYVITGNTFDGAFGNTFTSSLRLKNNVSDKTTTVSGNTFSGHNRGISLENYRSVTIDNNVFTPLSTSATYQHITVNTKELSSSSGFYQPNVDATITNNSFNASAVAGGSALVFQNHDNDNPTFGSFVIGGVGNENDFAAGIGVFVALDGQSGPTAAPITTMAPWATNLAVAENNFDVGAGLQTPAAMTLAARFELENKIQHGVDYGALGFVTTVPTEVFVTTNSFLSPFTTTPSIQRGVDEATTGDTVNVDEGAYAGNVSLNKSLTMRGSNRGISGCDTRNPESQVTGEFILAANEIEVDGFAFTGTGSRIRSSGASSTESDISLINNHLFATTAAQPILHGFGTGGGIGSTNWTVSNNKIADIQANAATAIALFNISNVDVTNNCIAHTNASFTGRRGINADGLQNAAISGNTIDMGDATPTATTNAPWAIQIGMSDQDAENVSVNENTILGSYRGVFTLSQRNLTGFSAARNAIGPVSVGIDFNTGSATPQIAQPVQSDISLLNNAITTVTPTVPGGIGAAIRLRNLHSTNANGPVTFDNVTINENSFTVPAADTAVIFESGLTASGANTNCNWWGSASSVVVDAKQARVVNFSPWLVDGTDDDLLAIGFQPVAGACSGTPILLSQTTINVSCFSFTDGAIDLTISGGTLPYTILWSNSATTEDISSLAAGTYDVTVTDANLSSATLSVVVTEPAILTLAALNNGPVFENDAVNFTSTAAGGTLPYTYVWTPATSLIDATVANPQIASAALSDNGLYYVNLEDANGCLISATTTLVVFSNTALYVNDNNLTGDVYTTAVGDNSNPGTPSAPLRDIQAAIDIAQPNTQIFVDAGEYAEKIEVTKSLVFTGAQAGQDADTRFAAFASTPNGPKADPAVETILTSPTSNPTNANPGANDLIRLLANNVEIDGFVVDGNNPALGASSKTVNGIDVHGRRGLTNLSGSNAEFAFTGLEFNYNILQNFGQRAISLSSASGSLSGNLISENVIRNFDTHGILMLTNAYIDITQNTFDVSPDAIGIHLQNFSQNGSATWSGNNVTVGQGGIGIHANLFYSPTSSLTIENNTVNAAASAVSGTGFTWGINLWSVQVGSTVTLNNNIVGASGGEFDRGINLWNLPTTNTVTVSGGSVANSAIGINLDNIDPYYGGGANTTVNVTGVNVSAMEQGIVVKAEVLPTAPLFAPNTLAGTVTLNSSGLVVNSAQSGAAVTASNVAFPATFGLNNASFTGGTEGVEINGAAAFLTGNTLANTIFSGQSGQYISLGSSPQNLDGTLASFDGNTGASASLTQNFAIEDKILHGIDDGALGFVRVHAVNAYVTENSFSAPATTAADIQRGIAKADAGDVVNVNVGTYPSFAQNKVLTVDGAGSTIDPLFSTVVSGGSTVDGVTVVAGSSATVRSVLKDVYVSGYSSSGVVAGGYTTLENVTSTGNTTYGLNVSNGTDLSITGSKFNSNSVGIKFSQGTDVDGLTIDNSEFNNNSQHGWFDNVSSSTPTRIRNVSVTNSTFNNNPIKGIYTEKVDQAIFDGITVNNSGTGVSGHSAGIDFNLKYNSYQNIQVINSTITNNGTNDPNGGGLLIKARSTGSYAAVPATLSNVLVANNFFSGNGGGGAYSASVRLGESNNSLTGIDAGPTAVTVTENSFGASTAAHQLRNATSGAPITANCNWWETVSFNDIENLVSGVVDLSSWLVDGTDDDLVALGFQPVAGACSGTPVSLSQTTTNVSCFSFTDGAIDLTISGGTLPYTILWSNSETTEDISSLAAGTYDVTVTDANLSSATLSVVVTEPAILTLSAVNDGPVFENDLVNFTATAAGGTLPYTYVWTPATSLIDATVANPQIASAALSDNGLYQVNLEDANGCLISATTTLVVFSNTALYVNDNILIGDVYTTAVGDNSNPGTASAPLRDIQAAIDIAQPNTQIFVDAGVYTEDLVLDKDLVLIGTNELISPNTGIRIAESVIQPATSDPDPYSATGVVMLYLEGNRNNVQVKGFTFDGDNPGLNSGVTMNGADVDVVEAMSGYDGLSNTVVENNIFKNINYAAIDFYNYTNNGAATTGNLVNENRFENIIPSAFGIGVLIYNNCYTSITNNVMEAVRVGVQTGNFYQADPGNSRSISANTLQTQRIALWHNLTYSNASPFDVTGNTVTMYPGGTNPTGILISSVLSAVSVNIANNQVTGAKYGINLWNCPTTSTITIQGGSLIDCEVGVFANNYDGYNSNATTSAYTIDGVSVQNASDAGVYVKDNSDNTNSATVSLSIGGATVVNGPATGLRIEGAGASAAFVGSNVSFTDQAAYIELVSNTIDVPTQALDATQVSFDGNTGAAASLAQNFAIEDKILHGIDDVALGFVTVKNASGFVTPNSFSAPATLTPSIQRGVDKVLATHTVFVDAGTYTETVLLNKPVTVEGANAGTSGCDTRNPESNLDGVFSLQSSGVSIQGFRITGNGPAIAAAGAGPWSDVTITDNLMEGNTGQQTLVYGFALGAVTNSIGANNWTVSNNKIADIQANDATGIALFNIDNLTITDNCIAHTNAAFQGRRGMNIDGAQTALISGNTVDMGLVAPANTTPNFNEARYSLQVSASNRPATGYTVSENQFKGAYDGMTTLGNGNVANLSVSGNFIHNNVIGVRLNAGSYVNGTTHTQVDITNNLFVTNARSSVFLSGNTASLANQYTGISVNENSLLSGGTREMDITNTIAFNGNVDATCNWWGTTNAPAIAALINDLTKVDFDPALSIGTDDDLVAQGFQPVAGSCASPVYPVNNITQNLGYLTIQGAVNHPTTVNSDIIEVDPGTYPENVVVNKSLTLRNSQPVRPVINGVATAAVVTVSAPNVTLDSLEIWVNQDAMPGSDKRGIFGPSSFSQVEVTNNLIRSIGTTSTPPLFWRSFAMEFGDQNVGSGYEVTIADNTVEDNSIVSFGRGIRLWNLWGAITGNEVKAHFALQAGANQGGATVMTGNTFRGLVEWNSFQTAQPHLISGNVFEASDIKGAGLEDFALLEFKDNSNAGTTIQVENNLFQGHTYFGIFSGRSTGITVENNTFTPNPASSSFVHIHVNNKQRTNALAANQTGNNLTGMTILDNNFAGSGSSGTGAGVEFATHNTGDGFGTIVLGQATKENRFAEAIGTFIRLDANSGPSSGSLIWFDLSPGSVTTMAPFAGNIQAQFNEFELGATYQTPATMNIADLFILENKVQHGVDFGALGFVAMVDDQAFVTQNSFLAPLTTEADIQRAVDKAADNWTITMEAGTYTPPVTVSADLTFANTGATTLDDLTMDGAGKTLALANDFTIESTLTASNGLVQTGSNVLTLSGSAQISESNDSYVLGTVQTTHNLSVVGTNYTLGGIGVELRAQIAPALGNTVVTRVTGEPQTANAPVLFEGVSRYFEVVPTNNSNLTANAKFKYFAHELNGNTDGQLEIFRSNLPFAANNWFHVGGNNSVSGEVVYNGFKTFNTRLSLSSNDQPLAEIDTVEIYGDTLIGIPNTLVEMPFRVKDFNSITGVQGTIEWDPAIVTYQATPFNPLGVNFGIANIATGKLTYSFFSGTGITLAPEDTLFTIQYLIFPGLPSFQATNLEFVIAPTPLEISQEKEANIEVIDGLYNRGRIEVPSNVIISGKAVSELGAPINTVSFNLTGTNGPQTQVGGSNGQYSYTVSSGYPAEIGAAKSNDQLSPGGVINGISTSDLVLMQRHLNSIQLLNSGYKLIAADVDQDQSLGIFDIVLLQNLILGNQATLPRLWHFVQSEYVFPNALNPWPFDSSWVFPSASAFTDRDFIGVKVGDVNNSWNSLNARYQTLGDVAFHLTDAAALPGQQVNMPVKVGQFDQVSGFQYTMEWDPAVLKLEHVQGGIITPAFGTDDAGTGILTASWFAAGGLSETLSDDETAFNLVFTVTGQLGDASPITITSTRTAAEAYNQEMEYLNIVSTMGTVFVGESTTAVDPDKSTMQLFQNQPNPFMDETMLKFSTLTQVEVNLEIVNALGQTVRTFTSAYHPGIHTQVWDRRNESGMRVAAGTYFCRLSTNGQAATIKLLIVD